MARQWILNSQKGFRDSLEYQQNIKVLSSDNLGPHDVLVKLHAASINYRELQIARPGSLNGPITPPIIPSCDGAGEVEAVGSAVREFCAGDRVVTHVTPKTVELHGDDAPVSVAEVSHALGQGTDGTLRSHAIFSEYALVHAPKALPWLQAATLSCTWTSAWNALFGLKGKKAGPGSWVLVQGTGGVSIAALQLAVATGASVVATTSTAKKEVRLKQLGARHVLNYRTTTNWGAEARKLTPLGRGFDFVLDVGGNQTLPQSLVAVRVDGVVIVIGHVGGQAEPVPLFAALLHTCIIRGILAASRTQFRDMVRFIEEKGLVPVIDDTVFELAEAKEAYEFLEGQKHFSKIGIRIDHPETPV